MELQFLATPLHLDEHPRRPHKIGETGAGTTTIFPHAVFQSCTGLLVASVTEGAKQAVTEYLRLALFVARQGFPVCDELLQPICQLAHRLIVEGSMHVGVIKRES